MNADGDIPGTQMASTDVQAGKAVRRQRREHRDSTIANIAVRKHQSLFVTRELHSDLGIEDGVSNRICLVHSVSRDRYGGLVSIAFDGNDATTTSDRFNAVEVIAICNG